MKFNNKTRDSVLEDIDIQLQLLARIEGGRSV